MLSDDADAKRSAWSESHHRRDSSISIQSAHLPPRPLTLPTRPPSLSSSSGPSLVERAWWHLAACREEALSGRWTLIADQRVMDATPACVCVCVCVCGRGPGTHRAFSDTFIIRRTSRVGGLSWYSGVADFLSENAAHYCPTNDLRKSVHLTAAEKISKWKTVYSSVEITDVQDVEPLLSRGWIIVKEGINRGCWFRFLLPLAVDILCFSSSSYSGHREDSLECGWVGLLSQ